MKRSREDEVSFGPPRSKRQICIGAEDVLGQGNPDEREFFTVMEQVLQALDAVRQGAESEDFSEDEMNVQRIVNLCLFTDDREVGNLETAPQFTQPTEAPSVEDDGSDLNGVIDQCKGVVEYFESLQQHARNHGKEITRLTDVLARVTTESLDLKLTSGNDSQACERELIQLETNQRLLEAQLEAMMFPSEDTTSTRNEILILMLNAMETHAPELDQVLREREDTRRQSNVVRNSLPPKQRMAAFRSGVASLCSLGKKLFDKKAQASLECAEGSNLNSKAAATSALETILLPRLRKAILINAHEENMRVEVVNTILSEKRERLDEMQRTKLDKYLPGEWNEVQKRIADTEKLLQMADTYFAELVDKQRVLWNKKHVPEQVKAMVEQHLNPMLAQLPGTLKLRLLDEEETQEESQQHFREEENSNLPYHQFLPPVSTPPMSLPSVPFPPVSSLPPQDSTRCRMQ
ncbi:hypothetical protein BASA82_000566 [Batrachochytrium salamandrivorans]|nr:hypothetical protein BASA81_003637 [Batrachochytrium salamandrivorans]KAH9262381.1 hypothetical protein BASA82_000566 [Batrachochytrium salamandrivorans]